MAGIREGYDVDFEPMRSPQDALQQSQLIVRGTLVDVFDGVEIDYPDDAVTERARGTYATFELSVEDVLFGDESLVTEGSVYVQVAKTPAVSAGDMAAANPRPSVLAFLIDIGGWSPGEQASVVRPDGLPEDAALLFANPDGLWLQTANDDELVAIHADRYALDPSWDDPRTLDDMERVVVRCRDGDCPPAPTP